MLGNGLGEVYPDLLIAGAIIVGMLPVLVLVTRRMQLRNAVGAA